MKSPAGKNKVSTDSIIRDIFEPVHKSGLLTRDPRTEVATVFFREKKPDPVGNRILWWAGLLGILFFSIHFVLTGLEQTALSRQVADFLEAKENEAQVLERQLAERKKKESHLKTLIRKKDEEIRTFEAHLAWIEKEAHRGKKTAVVLAQLADLSPPGIWIQEFTIEELKIRLKGYSVGPDLLPQYLEKLNQSHAFENVEVLSMGSSGGVSEPFYTFEVTGDVLS